MKDKLHPADPLARFADLQKQGFMRAAMSPRKKRTPKPQPPTIACEACMDWHRKGKHSKSKAERAALKAQSHIPALEPHCGSWIVSRIADGSVIGEFFSRDDVAKFSPATCKVETAAQYLTRINSETREKKP